MFKVSDLKKTALALDFDDTIARHIYEFMIEKLSFSLLGTFDQERTFRSYFEKASKQYIVESNLEGTFPPIYQTFISLCKKNIAQGSYSLLDSSLPELLQTYREDLGFITVFSGMSYHESKQPILSSLGITNYLTPQYLEDKAEALARSLPKGTQTIIFVDNSLEFAIEPFRKQIVNALKTHFIPEIEGQVITVYTFHHQLFEQELIAKPDVLENEVQMFFKHAEPYLQNQ